MAALTLVSSGLHVPVVVIVEDGKSNVEKAVGKLTLLIDVCYVSDTASWQAMAALETDRFKQGKLVLVVCGACRAQLDHLKSFLVEHCITGDPQGQSCTACVNIA